MSTQLGVFFLLQIQNAPKEGVRHFGFCSKSHLRKDSTVKTTQYLQKPGDTRDKMLQRKIRLKNICAKLRCWREYCGVVKDLLFTEVVRD